MTLNSIIKRIRENSLAHKQIETFRFGRPTEFLNDKTLAFPAVFLQDNGGTIDRSLKTASMNFRMFILDLVNVADQTKENEQDVLSDCLSIAQDLIAIFGHDVFFDWKFGAENNFELAIEQFDDMVAGVIVDITISWPYLLDACAVPTTDPISGIVITTPDMKIVYDLKYVSEGDEGSTLTIPEIGGKEVLLVTREFAVLYPITTGSPSSTEYLFNGTTIQLGVSINPSGGERFLILYRNS